MPDDDDIIRLNNGQRLRSILKERSRDIPSKLPYYTLWSPCGTSSSQRLARRLQHSTQLHHKRVIFNESVAVRTFTFNAWERTWRRIIYGSVQKTWDDLAERYAARRSRKTGRVFAAKQRAPQRLQKIRFVGDTGATWHMCGKDFMKALEGQGYDGMGCLTQGRKVELETVNGTVTCCLQVPVKTEFAN